MTHSKDSFRLSVIKENSLYIFLDFFFSQCIRLAIDRCHAKHLMGKCSSIKDAFV